MIQVGSTLPEVDFGLLVNGEVIADSITSACSFVIVGFILAPPLRFY